MEDVVVELASMPKPYLWSMLVHVGAGMEACRRSVLEMKSKKL